MIMPPYDMVLPAVALVSMLAAIALDRIRGDPPNRYHPTAWIGRVVAALVPMRPGNGASRRAWGVVVVAASCVSALALSMVPLGVGMAAATISGGVPWGGHGGMLLGAAGITYYAATILLLKSAIAVRGMEEHAAAVGARLRDGDPESAGDRLALITKRNTSNMDPGHICSGAIESISENTVDGITGPLFYFGLAGLPGALVYRAVNTIDSMAGYRSPMLADLGWFGAKCDTILNWAPARLTAYVMVLAAATSRYDARGALRAIRRDAKKPDSRNSGYPMAAMAGALGVRLEKPLHYTIGDGPLPDIRDIWSAIRIMRRTTWLFAGVACVPGAALALVVL